MPCTECRRDAPRLRRHRCDACYMRLYRNGEIAAGATCVSCGERRTALLEPARLDGPIVVCGNCGLVLRKTRPAIASVAELRLKAARERRAGADRRAVARGGRRGADRSPAPRRPAFDPCID